jgi:membrane protease YdiL (CAAX protease family)
MTTLPGRDSYPNTAHSVAIAGMVILASLVFSPFIFLQGVIGAEASILVYYLPTMGVPLWIAHAIRKKKTGATGFDLTLRNRRIVPFVMLASVTLLFGVAEPISSLIPISDFFRQALLDMAGQSGFFAFLLMVVAAPIFEELLFRGIILEGLLNNYTTGKAVLISSLIFGAVHLNPWQFVTGTVLGIFMGWVYANTRSVLPTIIIHASANATGYLMRFFVDIESMLDQTIEDTFGSIVNYGLFVVGSILLMLVCVFFLKKEFRKTELGIT